MALLGVAGVLVAAGCGSDDGGGPTTVSADAKAALPPAPEPATVPVTPGVTPAGATIPIGAEPEGVAALPDGRVVTAHPNPPRLEVVRLTGRGVGVRRDGPVQTVPLPGTPRHLRVIAGTSTVIAPDENTDQLVLVDLSGPQPQLRQVTVGRQPHDADAAGPDGPVVVGDELSDDQASIVDITGPEPRVSQTLPTSVQPGGVACDPARRRCFAVGVRENTIVEYAITGPGQAREVTRLPAGQGATHIDVDREGGRAFVADTRGGAILIYGGEPIAEIGRVGLAPGSAPYAIAYNGVTKRLYVGLTGTNQVVAIDPDRMAVDGAPLATSGQPYSAVALPDGRLVLADRAEGLLQVIDPASFATAG